MSAEILRRAADRLREAVEVAASQPAVNAAVSGVWLNLRYYPVLPTPAALALADWLDEAADHLAISEDDRLQDPCPTALEGLECSVLGQALAVARAYLGEQP